jgi:ABC-type antimicrobial peptide transport system permease subunit
MPEHNNIPEQTEVSWPIVFAVSLAGMRRRLIRAIITMVGVVLAIAFLCYMLVNETLVKALIALDKDALNVLLQNAGVDIFSGGKSDQMTLLLIGLTLLTSLVGIINAMLMAVSERVREIGTLKCLGATDTFIVRAYFIESTVQGVCGALLGLGLGLVVALGVSLRAYGRYTLDAFPVGGVLVALLISLAAGVVLSVLAAIVPAYMAARKQPIESLRVEE